MRFTRCDTAVGELLLSGDDDGLNGLYFFAGKHLSLPEPAGVRDDSAFPDVREQLAEYFTGGRTSFELRLNPRGNAFQHRVWGALREIPYGTTTSYGMLAASIGSPLAARAVGMANGRNPISIIVPCHRVIGANGKLTGFGGGVEAKRFLLELEARSAGATPALFDDVLG